MKGDGWMPHWGGEGGEEMLQDRPEQRSQAGSSQGWRFGDRGFCAFFAFWGALPMRTLASRVRFGRFVAEV